MLAQEHQPYDRALKSLFGDEAAEILPRLVEGVTLVSEQNIEIDRSTLRADLVYNVLYEGEPHILSLELQTGADKDMPTRMLTYHVGLLVKHGLPIISVILYPFETTLPESPFMEKSGTKELLRFHYRVLAIWEQDAQQIVQESIIQMYTFLPAMKNANVQLLLQAIREMEQYYTRDRFINHLSRFRVILNRSTSLSEKEKQMVNDTIYEYDSLLDNDPDIQKKVAEGETRGETRGAQKIVTTLVEVRFPTLVEVAQERIVSIQNVDMLNQLAKQIFTAQDEQTALWVLNSYAA